MGLKMSKKIFVKDILPLDNQNDFKIQFAVWDNKDQPLNVFLSSAKEFQSWNEYKGNANIWTKKYIFSLVDFYHEQNVWLFAGIWEVLNIKKTKHIVRLTTIGDEFVGRLKINYELKSRNRRRLMLKNGSSLYDQFTVKEILKEEYSGVEFKGYDEIRLEFDELKVIFDKNVQSWKDSLSNIKGIYLIADKKSGKNYIGSAYEEAEGIWGRWRTYIQTGHGNHSKKLKDIVKVKGLAYAKENFTFCLLESFTKRVEDTEVLGRERFWKDALLSRQFGYNDN